MSVLKKFEEAQESYDLAINFKPDYLKAYLNKGRSFKENGQFEKALFSFQKAKILNPNIELLSGELLETQMHLCIWEDFEESLIDIRQKINSRVKTINPFPLLGLLDDPGLQRNVPKLMHHYIIQILMFCQKLIRIKNTQRFVLDIFQQIFIIMQLCI